MFVRPNGILCWVCGLFMCNREVTWNVVHVNAKWMHLDDYPCSYLLTSPQWLWECKNVSMMTTRSSTKPTSSRTCHCFLLRFSAMSALWWPIGGGDTGLKTHILFHSLSKIWEFTSSQLWNMLKCLSDDHRCDRLMLVARCNKKDCDELMMINYFVGDSKIDRSWPTCCTVWQTRESLQFPPNHSTVPVSAFLLLQEVSILHRYDEPRSVRQQLLPHPAAATGLLLQRRHMGLPWLAVPSLCLRFLRQPVHKVT